MNDNANAMAPAMSAAEYAELMRNFAWFEKLNRLLGLGKPGAKQARTEVRAMRDHLDQLVTAFERSHPHLRDQYREQFKQAERARIDARRYEGARPTALNRQIEAAK